MDKVRYKPVNGKAVACPMCSGHGFTVEPFNQKHERRGCSLCGGTTELYPDDICSCGRPIIWTYRGYLICNSIGCEIEVDNIHKDAEEAKQREKKRRKGSGAAVQTVLPRIPRVATFDDLSFFGDSNLPEGFKTWDEYMDWQAAFGPSRTSLL